MKECLWCWLVWVLLSVSIIQRFVIQRNVLWVAFRGPFGPFLVRERSCKICKSDFSTLCCKLFFDDTVFQCVFFFFLVCYRFVSFLCFPKHDSSLFVQGLVDKCTSMWRITIVAQSRNVWEIKEASFNKQHVKQSVRWSIFSAELLSDFHRMLKRHHMFCCEEGWILMCFNRLVQRRKNTHHPEFYYWIWIQIDIKLGV